VDVVAIVGLGRSVEEEAPQLAADLGLTPYEVGVMLRAAPPIIVLRTEERARAIDVLGKLRARGHDAVACDLAAVVPSDAMFRPKSFRFEGSELVGHGNGEERRLPLGDVFSLVRANHTTRTEATVVEKTRKVSIGRAALTGGMLTSKTSTVESTRITNEREAVLYVFRNDAAPWLLASMEMRYDGLGQEMKISKMENFEVLLRVLRERAPSAPFDARLLAVRANTSVVSAGPKQLSLSSSATIDVLAHVVAIALGRAARPYR
jgi:hypothetical protein